MARHAKTDSDVTSLAASTPPRSPRGRPAYYVLSPAASHPDVHVGASGGVAGTTPAESPLHYHFHHHHRQSSGAAAAAAGMHHSRESSTGRLLFSDQLRSGGDVAAVVSVPWRRLGHGGSGAGSVGDDDDEDDASLMRGGFAESPWRCYALGAFAFFAVFAFFLLVLWGASRSYKPHVVVKSVVFESYHIQGGTDRTGVPTKMMSVNATVRLRFRNRGTFFSLHVTATPFLLFYGDLTVASGDGHSQSETGMQEHARTQWPWCLVRGWPWRSRDWSGADPMAINDFSVLLSTSPRKDRYGRQSLWRSVQRRANSLCCSPLQQPGPCSWSSCAALPQPAPLACKGGPV